MERFDLIVIGAGPGGYVAAIRAAQLGDRVACIDRRPALGGTCLNIGCIPSKALLDSSEYYALAKSRLANHGIQFAELKLNLQQMMQRKDRVVKGLTDGVAFLLRKHHVTVVQGTARLSGAQRVSVRGSDGTESMLEAAAILLATGSEPTPLPSLPNNGTTIVSSTEALNFDRVPAHLIVVGGGYIGLEIGSVWARLGAKVSVLEYLPRISATSDAEISTLLTKALTKQGLEIHSDTKVTGGSVQGERVTVTTQHGGQSGNLEGDRALIAVGRRPATGNLGLEHLGIALDPKSGRVPVNADYQTSVSGVYAVGDLVTGPMLAHKAEDEGIVFAERLHGMKTHVNYQAIPSVIYTWPEVASVGMTEEEVKKAERNYRVGRFPFAANGRARCMDETEGFVKIITDAQTDRILGVHIIGPRASELIAEAVNVVEFAGGAEDIARICHAHPTLSEAVREAALAVDKRAIHS